MSNYNFTIVKGEDFLMDILIRDAETHIPEDITGVTFTAQCRDHVNSDLVLFDFTMTPDVDPLTGRAVMAVARDITTGLVVSAGVYDVWGYNTSDDNRDPLFSGKITFKESVTPHV